MDSDFSVHRVTIYYHHTDCGGVVYYARYLEFFEEARTLFFAGRGISIAELARAGTFFVVSRQEIEYKFPGVYADTLEVRTQIGAVTGVRVEFIHEIVNQNGRLIVKGKTTMVCVDKGMRPQGLPDDLRQKLRV